MRHTSPSNFRLLDLQLPLDPRQADGASAVPAPASRSAHPPPGFPQRESLSRTARIADAVLVMNRQRLGGRARAIGPGQPRASSTSCRQDAAASVVHACARRQAMPPARAARRSGRDRSCAARRAAALDRAAEAARAPAALELAPPRRRRGRARAPRAASLTASGPLRVRVQQPRGERGERQQIQPVVLEDRLAAAPRRRCARTGSIPAGNLEARQRRRGRPTSGTELIWRSHVAAGSPGWTALRTDRAPSIAAAVRSAAL